MGKFDRLVDQAVDALKANRRDEARRILEYVVDQDQHHEQAWLWLSGCVDSVDEQIICLENVLTINPDNHKARKGMETLQRQRGGAARPAVPPSPGSPPPLPGASPAPKSGVPSSVDWGGGAPGATPALGSGKKVQLPSDEEYDNWLASLSIGNGVDGPPAPGQPGNVFAGPFSSSAPAESAPSGEADSYDPYSYDVYSPVASQQSGYGVETYDYNTAYSQDQAYDPGYGQQADPYNAGQQSVPGFGASPASSPAAPDPFDTYDLSGFNTFGGSSVPASSPAIPAFSGPAAHPPGQDAYEQDPYNAERGYENSSGFETDGYDYPGQGAPAAQAEDLTTFEDFGLDTGNEEGARPDPVLGMGTVALGSSSAAMPQDRYFSIIPEDIQLGAPQGGAGALIAAVGLIALNAVSIILLLSNLGG